MNFQSPPMFSAPLMPMADWLRPPGEGSHIGERLIF